MMNPRQKTQGKSRPPFNPTPIVAFHEMPGFTEAVRDEQEKRDEAYLALNKSIAGFVVTPLLFRQYLTLRFIQSPLIYGGTPTPIDLARFLWMLSPKFGANRWFLRFFFMRRCRKEFRDIKRAAEIVEAARAFIAEAKFDAPKSAGVGYEKEYYSDACAVCNLLGRELGRTREEVMNTPMAILLQELREIKHDKLGAKSGLTNPSDAISLKWCREQNAKLQNQ